VPPEKLPPDNPLRQIVSTWMKKIEAAIKYKRPFTEDAKEAASFFDGEHNFMWKDQYARGERGYNSTIAPPAFRMQVNKVFELVEIFGSVIYHRNPVRNVTVMEHPQIDPGVLGVPPPDPSMGMMPTPEQQQVMAMLQQQEMSKAGRKTAAQILQAYLNWTPVELDLKTQARKVCNEALIKGAGAFWTELVTLQTSGDNSTPPVRMIGSFYDTIDNLLVDPDFDNLDDMLWCARKVIRPLREVAQEYGVPEEDLKKHLDGSKVYRNDSETRDRNKPKKSKTNDLVCYYKIWSKTGAGDRLADVPKDNKGVFDALGDFVYLVVCEGVDYPLNMPPSVMEEPLDESGQIPQSLMARAAWPIPWFADPKGWPFTMLSFHTKPNYAWPISHIRPAIPELRFLNWAMSFLATRVATSCETMIGVSKAADQDLKDQLLAPTQGGFKIVEISEMLGRSVNDVVSVFQLPQVTKDLYDIIAAVFDLFDKRTGLSELAYGITRAQYRSAAEAQIKQENISIRPDNLANELEDCMSLLARREALAARWLLTSEDVVPVLGPIGAVAWDKEIAKRDIVSLTRDFLYRVEAGSARKPNKATRVEQMQMAVQTLGPLLQPVAMAGFVDPLNALISDWADSLDIDPLPYLLPPPPPPAPEPLPPGVLPPSPDAGAAPADGLPPPEAMMPPGLPGPVSQLSPQELIEQRPPQ
jgi:hypothetical protein